MSLGGLPYLPLERGHVGPGVGGGVVALHGGQIVVVDRTHSRFNRAQGSKKIVH